MNIIKGLLKKDLFNLASYKSSLIIIFICIFAIGTMNESTANFIPIIMSAMIGMIALATFNYDEVSKSEKYVLPLPTNRKKIILEKYILIISCTIIGGILGFIITPIIINIINYIKAENIISVDYESLLSVTIGGIFGISLISAIQIPSVYKWGAERGRIQMFILLFALFAIVGGIGYLIINNIFNIDVEAIKNIFNKFGLLILIILSAIMYYVSYKISYKIYKNKEY